MLDFITKEFEGKISSIKEDGYNITIICEKIHFIEILKRLKENKFNILTDLSAIDFPEREQRFELVYNLLNIFDNKRIIIKFSIKDGEKVESISSIFKAATWYEREVWDMFGIHFNNCPDMRRILTDYGFEGHPLRKDFPLTGFKEVHYSEEQKQVVYAPVELPQDYRSFDFLSPWEGPNYVLPGDEKCEKK